MDSKNNIGHSADISFTRMNSWIMFFLSGLRTHKTMSMVATSPVWIVKEKFSIQINLSGCKVARCGCFPCFTTR